MTPPARYQSRSVPVELPPLSAAAQFARAAAAPFVVYERNGEWSCGSGAVAEVVLRGDELRYRLGAGDWRVQPTGADPLRQVADVLDVLDLTDWRAYGWAAFELGLLLQGLPVPAGTGPLLQLVVPQREVRLSAGVAVLRAVDATELAELARAVTAAPPGRRPVSPGVDTAAGSHAGSHAGGVVADLEHGVGEYRNAVVAAVADIRAERLRKVILSRVVPVDADVDLVATYEVGRRGNTPARSFLLDLGQFRAAGFSPETVVEVSAEGLVATQPLAGTRALTGDVSVDQHLREILLADPKELYEHAVSVQACQDELRRVCRAGSVVVDEFLNVLARGSVQHIGSRVAGRLAAGRDGWDALASLFPSITASGVPKAAACALIGQYEPEPRGLYSGAVLTVDADGALDAALVLRTVFQRDGRTWLRAGAGIVEQSDPDREVEETKEKLRSVSRFLVAAPAPAPVAFAAPAIPAIPAKRSVSAVATASIRLGAGLDDVRQAVAELLDEDPAEIGDEVNLFELGLESIALMRAVGRWRRAGVEVSFGELAENPTVDGWFKLLSMRAPETRSDDPGADATLSDATTLDATTLAASYLDATLLDETVSDGTGGDEPLSDETATGEFPLALMQHAYWVGRDGGQPLGQVAAHLYTEFDGTGIDVDRLRTAIERLVARHDMLRVRITDNGRQVVEAVSGWRGLVVNDLRDRDTAEVTARLDAVRDELSHQLLDIERGEVFATVLSLLPAGRTRLHLDVDMVAADAVSYRVLLADLARLYERPAAPLPPLGYTYRRYREAWGPARREAARVAAEWWRGRLPGLPGAPELPRAASANAQAGDGQARDEHEAASPARVSRRHFTLSPQARDALGRAAHSRGVTPAMAVATAFAEVLGGWSAESRFVLNVPLFDREQVHPDIDHVVGDFTSSVLLEVDLTEPLDFAARVRQVQARLHADAAHAAYSGVEVLRDLTRRTTEQVLAPVVFTSALNLGELFDPAVRRHFGDPVWIISQGPQVLLDAQVTELDGGLLVNWDVRDGEFAAGVVDAMFGAFERLVRSLAEGTATWENPVSDLVPQPVEQLRRAVNDTAGPESRRLLHEGFFRHATRTPDAPALLWDGAVADAAVADAAVADGAVAPDNAAVEVGPSAVTYGELSARSLRLAAELVRRGVGPGDLVGVSLPKGPNQVVAVLGVLAAGGTYVPVGVDQPAARVARIAAVAGFHVMIAEPSRGELPDGVVRLGLTALESATATDTPEPVGSANLAAPDELGGLDRPAYVLFTSGSTGQPKGVEVGHRAAMNTIDDLVDRLGLGPDDRTLAVSALDFDLSVFDVFAPLSVGGAVVLVDEGARREARRWAELVRDHRVTVLNCVPTVLDLVLGAGVALGDSLRVVLLGGDRVGVDLPGRLAAAVPGCRFLGLGGTTETAIHSTVCEVVGGGPVPADWRSVPYGTPLRNVRLRVVDPLGRDCPDYVTGELWIGGAGVARGYLGDPERTADRFVEYADSRWYRTGDIARYLPDGTVEFLGRRDDQVKIRGFRVELGEVEAALASVPGVRAGVAVLVGGGPAGRGPVLGAGVVSTVGADAGADADTVASTVRESLRQALPPHMVPDLVVVLRDIPLTANGKIDRRAVSATVARAMAGRGPDRTPPRTDLERVIANVWRDVLGVDEFGVTDEFFALGGDSVLATAVVARLRDDLDTAAVSVRALFGAPTVAALAERMRAADSAAGRLDRVATIALEIAALSDDEVAAELADADVTEVDVNGAAR